MKTRRRGPFVDLLMAEPQLSGGLQQQRAAENFPSLVERGHMNIWRPENDFPPPGSHVIWIAVATWSLYDLELLDLLETKLSRDAVTDNIYVFDTAGSPDIKDFNHYLPGVGKVYHTPVVGSWTNGVLEEKLSGAVARNWLVHRYGLPRVTGTA